MQTRIFAFLSLIRLPNLLMLALVQVLVIRYFLPAFLPTFQFENWKLISLILSICCLAAGGNLINAYYDQQTDLINQNKLYNHFKHFGKRRTILSYGIFSLIGISLGFVLSWDTENYFIFALYAIVFILLFAYSKYLKGSFLIGNLVVSICVGLSIWLPFLLSLNHSYFTFKNNVFQLMGSYVILAFFINLARELAKDTEDIVGDFACLHQTFPIVLGRKRTKLLMQFIILICLSGLISAYFAFFVGQLFPMLYIFLVLISTGIYIFVKTGKAKHKSDFSKLSMAFKVWMFLGIISMGFYSF